MWVLATNPYICSSHSTSSIPSSPSIWVWCSPDGSHIPRTSHDEHRSMRLLPAYATNCKKNLWYIGNAKRNNGYSTQVADYGGRMTNGGAPREDLAWGRVISYHHLAHFHRKVFVAQDWWTTQADNID